MNINSLNDSPIHEQIELNIKKQIIKGILKPGDRLLSVREMATTIKVNPNTVTRAYKQLEKESYIVILPGKGIFIKNTSDTPVTITKEKALRESLELQLLENHYHNISKERIIEWCEEFFIKVGK